MKTIIIGMAALLGASVASGPAAGWASANRYGGSTTHSYGETSHTNAYGGSTSHAYGEGTEHTNAYGGTTAHGWDGGTTHTNVYGGTTTGVAGVGAVHTSATGYTTAATAYHPPYPTAVAYAPYHPPVAVPYYSSGCYNCGSAAAAGAVVGLAAGAAIASANTAAATSNAYAAGVATGSANTAAVYSSVAPAADGRHDDDGDNHNDKLCDGRELRRRPGRFHLDQQERHDVLPERQYLVPAGVRC